jgi:NADH pyrophosphatase NudC (nudix superfamily)
MLGFWALADPQGDATLTPEPEELLEVRWFGRDELRTALREEQIVLPPPGTIGNFLISTWLATIQDGDSG